MIIKLKKFGDILTSREAGREALLAFAPTLRPLGKNEEIIIDFDGVSVLTPSWADEFIRSLIEKYGKKVLFIHDTNPSVQAALRFANPKLSMDKITVFKDVLVFDEKTDGKIFSIKRAIWVPTFPYNDDEALRILKNHRVKKIYVHPVDALKDSPRIKAVVQMLNQAGIKTVVR